MEKNVIDKVRPPKVYRIERDEKTGTVIIHVGVKWPAGFSWRFSTHCDLHSPNGFEAGYGAAARLRQRPLFWPTTSMRMLVGLSARGEAGLMGASPLPSDYISPSNATCSPKLTWNQERFTCWTNRGLRPGWQTNIQST
jgi:hypothetical protein